MFPIRRKFADFLQAPAHKQPVFDLSSLWHSRRTFDFNDVQEIELFHSFSREFTMFAIRNRSYPNRVLAIPQNNELAVTPPHFDTCHTAAGKLPGICQTYK